MIADVEEHLVVATAQGQYEMFSQLQRVLNIDTLAAASGGASNAMPVSRKLHLK